MTESLDEVDRRRRSQSLLPMAMVVAFVAGAAVAGWLIFGEDLKQWSRQEQLAWHLEEGERLVLVQHRRTRRIVSEEPERTVEARLTWDLRPMGTATIPGAEPALAVTLREAEVEAREGAVVVYTARVVPPSPGAEAPAEPETELPDWIALLPDVAGLELVLRPTADATGATSATPVDTLERVQTRRTGRPPGQRPPLDEADVAALDAAVTGLLQDVVVDLAPLLDERARRPGGSFNRELAVRLAPWGREPLAADVRLDRYEGPIAHLEAIYHRQPAEGEALAAGDTELSGLKGTGAYRLDVAADRPVAGVTTLEASGKVDRRFATFEVHNAWALATGGQTPEIPADYAPTPLLPPEAEVASP